MHGHLRPAPGSITSELARHLDASIRAKRKADALNRSIAARKAQHAGQAAPPALTVPTFDVIDRNPNVGERP